MRFKALCVVGIFFASTSIALAANVPAGLDRVEGREVRDQGRNRPASGAGGEALEAELRKTVASYGALELTAAVQHGHYHQLEGKIHNLRYRSSTALKQVQRGLEIDAAACAGTGSRGRPTGSAAFAARQPRGSS